MTRAASRIPERLYRAVTKLAEDRQRPIAEIAREVGALADRIGVPRPSYERVRTLVHEARSIRRGPSTPVVLVEVAARARPPSDFLDHLADDLKR